MTDSEEILEEYKKRVNSFSESELAEVSSFFSMHFGQRYIKSKEDAFEILLEEGLKKAVNALPEAARVEFKKKILSI